MQINPNVSQDLSNTPMVASDHLPITRDIDGSKVLSWNIRWSENDALSVWTNRLPAIVSNVKNSNSDVVCFQEVSPMMLADLKNQLSPEYQCASFSQNGALATFYKPTSMNPVQSMEQKYRSADHNDGQDRYYMLTEFHNLNTNETLHLANLKGPHLSSDDPSDSEVQGVLEGLKDNVNLALQKNWGESSVDVNLCGDWNNKITPGALPEGMVNHSDVNGLGTQVGAAFTDATNGKADRIDQPGVFTKIDDQFLELNGSNTNVDANVDTNLFAWGAQPTPPPLSPEVQKYEQGLQIWLTQNEGKQNGYLANTYVQPLINKINAMAPPFTTVAQITNWLNNDGQVTINGLLNSNIYSSNPDFASMDPLQAQYEIQSLLVTMGITNSAPFYPVIPIIPGPPPPNYIDKLESSMKAWAGTNAPPFGKSGKQAFNDYLDGYIQSHNITTAAGLNSAMPDLLKTDDMRGIYFKCPGLNDTDLNSAIGLMGLTSPQVAPPMSNLAKSFSNVVNYCNGHQKDATHFMKPFYAIRDYISQNVNLSENTFKSFVNGSFRTDPNINFKNFSAVPAYQHQLKWFSANLSDWK